MARLLDEVWSRSAFDPIRTGPRVNRETTVAPPRELRSSLHAAVVSAGTTLSQFCVLRSRWYG
jgi:hypothetical protein